MACESRDSLRCRRACIPVPVRRVVRRSATHRRRAERSRCPRAPNVTMNLVVTDTPVRRRPPPAHRDAATAHADWGAGHADDADLTLTTDYADRSRDPRIGRSAGGAAGVHGGQGEDPGRPHEADGGTGHRRRPRVDPASRARSPRSRSDRGIERWMPRRCGHRFDHQEAARLEWSRRRDRYPWPGTPDRAPVAVRPDRVDRVGPSHHEVVAASASSRSRKALRSPSLGEDARTGRVSHAPSRIRRPA